jgi:hypothetical protein
MTASRWRVLAFAVASLAGLRGAAQTAAEVRGTDEVWCRVEGVGLARCARSWAQCEATTRADADACRRLDRTMYCFEITARGRDAAENGLLECHATADACHEGRKATARGPDVARKPSRCEPLRPAEAIAAPASR